MENDFKTREARLGKRKIPLADFLLLLVLASMLGAALALRA